MRFFLSREMEVEMVRKNKGDADKKSGRKSPRTKAKPRVPRKKKAELPVAVQRNAYIMNYCMPFASKDWLLVQELKRYFVMGFWETCMYSRSVHDLWVKFSEHANYREFCDKAFGGFLRVDEVVQITSAGDANYFERVYREFFRQEPDGCWGIYWDFRREQKRKALELEQQEALARIEENDRRYSVYQFVLLAGGDVSALGPEYDVMPSWYREEDGYWY